MIVLSLIVGFVIGVVLTNNHKLPKYNCVCKYCGMHGHTFTECGKLSVKQKKALETLFNEENNDK